MAIAALVVWLCTAAAGTYLLVTAARGKEGGKEGQPPGTAPAATVARVADDAAEHGPAREVRARDRFDPPSLTRAKSEPFPGLRALAEFTHPALAIVGLGFWLGYVMTRDRVFAAIGFGVLLGAVSAGVSWVASSRSSRARKDALSPSPRLLALHAAGAALTVLIATLIVARV